MKKILAAAVCVVAAGCLPNDQKKQIVVDGEASLEFAPDIFMVGATLRARKDTQAAALADIADRLARIRETLPNLEGLTHLTIDASAAELIPIQDYECMEKRRYSNEEQCPITGYFGSISLTVKASPANASGRTLSLISEIGAESVSLSGYALSDMDKARKGALDVAVRDARQKAVSIASAAGAVVTGPIRIQYGDGFGEDRTAYMLDVSSPALDLAYAQQVITPETDLDLDPQPIKIKAKIVAAFELE